MFGSFAHMKTLLLLLPVALVGMPVDRPGQVEAPVAPPPTTEFDHSHRLWSEVLAAHVHPGGLVDYRGLRERRADLDAYLAGLERVTVKEYAAWKAEPREAFWINAYNAYTVRLILDNYPVESIQDLGGFFSPVWSKRFIPLQHLSAKHGKVLSLDEVEHGILAGISRKPLFHFAIVCASASCPDLQARAYRADTLDAQLADAGRRFLADRTKNEQTVRGGKLHLSKIFDWSKKELATYPGGIRGLLLEFGPASMSANLKEGKVRYVYLDYDWSLNEWIPPQKKR